MTFPGEYREEFESRAALHALATYEARVFADELAAASDAEAALLRDFEEVAANLALAAPEATPSADVRKQLLARVAASREAAAARPAGPRLMIDVRYNEIEWQPMAENIFYKPLYYNAAQRELTSLVWLLPGARLPNHQHLGTEQCLIIEGGFRVGDKVYGPGDFQVLFEGTTHEDIYTETGAVVLLIAPPEYRLI